MEKSFQLDQKEAALVGQLDQERTQALAVVGALSLDMEQARKNLDSAAERQRSFIRQSLNSRGIERYDSARTMNGALIVVLPDQPVMEPPPPEPPAGKRRNGPLSEVKE